MIHTFNSSLESSCDRFLLLLLLLQVQSSIDVVIGVDADDCGGDDDDDTDVIVSIFLLFKIYSAVVCPLFVVKQTKKRSSIHP